MHRRVTSILTATLLLLITSANVASAATGSIIPPDQYSWDDNGGYVNWDATGGNVTVTDTGLTGYIWSAGFGWINLAPTNGGVTNNNGTLSGYAWGANTGWIDFTGVTIDSNGVFHGHTVDQSIFGTMTFDCTYCNVTSSWLAPATPAPPPSTAGSASNGMPANSGPLSYGYLVPSAASSSQSTTKGVPPALLPTSPPPTIEPTTKPAPTRTHPSFKQTSPLPVAQPTQPQQAGTTAGSAPTTPIASTTATPEPIQLPTAAAPQAPATPPIPLYSAFTHWLQGIWNFIHSLLF